MGKPVNFGVPGHVRHDALLPAGFDEEFIATFFQGKGVSDKVLSAVKEALEGDDEKLGDVVAEVAKATDEAVEDDDQFFAETSDWVYLETTQDDMLNHQHSDHDHDHICDENCGDDCAHAAHSEQDSFRGADGRPAHAAAGRKSETDEEDDLWEASGKPTHAGGGKKSTNDDGSRGNGKKKIVEPTNEDDSSQEPAPAPEPEPEPAPLPEPEPEPLTDPEPEPDPAPQPAPAQFGWVDDFTYISGGDTPDGFNLELKFNGDWTDSQKDMAASQAEILSDKIIGDINGSGDIDDVRIQMYTENLDGAGGVWGRGGLIQKNAEGMALEGRVRLDENDLGTAESWGMLDELMMHEMLHATGFGITWSQQGLIDGDTFIGQNAVDVYGGAVPIDGRGHLSESVGDEMGTTYITNNAEPITDLTLAVLEDMGFETIYDVPEEEEDPFFDEMLLG